MLKLPKMKNNVSLCVWMLQALRLNGRGDCPHSINSQCFVPVTSRHIKNMGVPKFSFLTHPHIFVANICGVRQCKWIIPEREFADCRYGTESAAVMLVWERLRQRDKRNL